MTKLLVLFFPVISWAGVIEIPAKYASGQYVGLTASQDPFCASGELKLSAPGDVLTLNSEIKLSLTDDITVNNRIAKCREHSVSRVVEQTASAFTIEQVLTSEKCKTKADEGESQRRRWTFSGRSLTVDETGIDASESHLCTFMRR